MMGSAHQEYTTRFQEVAQLVPHLCTPKSRWIERYIWGLAPQVRGTTIGRNPQTAQEATEFSVALTDEGIRTGAFGKVVPIEKRKWNNNKNHSGSSRNSNTFKKPANAIKTFVATQPQAQIQQETVKVGYAGPNLKCNKCRLHHVGQCVPCQKYGRVGHLEKYCKSRQIGCYECEALDHFRSACPKVARAPAINQGHGRAFALNANEARQDTNVVTGTFPVIVQERWW
jgi:hypothetical protein